MSGTWAVQQTIASSFESVLFLQTYLYSLLALTQQRILVSSGDNIQFLSLRVVTQPTPTATLNSGDLSVELGLQLVQSAKVTVNSVLEQTVAEFTTAVLLGGEVLPEQGVVDVSTAVKVDSLLEGDGGFDVLLVECLAELLFSGVETVDVGLMVLGVVKLHDLGRNGGLECTIVVREVGKGVLATNRGGASGKGAKGGSLESAGGSGECGAKHVDMVLCTID